MAFQVRPSVLWREGMFLCPQHLQVFSREVNDRAHAAASIGSPGDWGIVTAQIDAEALRRDTLVLDRAEIVFPDGTLAAFPGNATVEQREFSALFEAASLDVFIGIPAIRPGSPGLSESGEADGARYRARASQVYDENAASAERELDFKLLQARLFFGDEDRTGYECVPLARLVRRGRPEAYSALCETHIPPVLTTKGSPVLVRELGEIADQLQAQARDLASRIPQTTMLSSVEKGADVAAFVKLQAVNQCVPGMDLMRRMLDLHPFHAYQQLIQAIGSLSIFADSRTVPSLEPFDHENLDACFHRAFEVIRVLITSEVSVPYDTELFQEDPALPGLLACSIPANWVSGENIVYLGVRATGGTDVIVDLASRALKLAAESELDNVLIGVTQGIELEHLRMAPLAFPKDGVEYFRISSEGRSREAWLKIVEARRALLIRADPSMADWEIGLYVELRG